MRQRWATFVESTSTQLWPVPTLGVFLAVGMGVGLTRLDRRIDDRLPTSLTDYLFTGGADAARSVLGAIATSLITVTSLTFSLTVVTLQLASSQFSPRLLRTFSRDRFVHVTLALFLATFAYALTVLRAVRSEGDDRTVFVPQISVTMAYLLTVASVIALVLFLAHLARQIRVETMLRNVHAEAEATAEVVLRERQGSQSEAVWPQPPPSAWTVAAPASGFLTSVDESKLLAKAIAAEAVMRLDVMPGDLLVAGTPMGFAWARDGHLLNEERFAIVEHAAREAIETGFERTSAQDIGFGLRQLTDVANKALSPGINDPTTAVHSIGHSSALLCELTRYRLGPRVLTDEEGAVRVALRRPELAELLELTVAQPRHYGAADVAVMSSLFDLLRSLAWAASLPAHHEAIEEQLHRLQRAADRQDFDDTERERLRGLGADVVAALHGRWNAAPSGADAGD